jgi:branched-chain amino acid transport system substrate-binding protein
MRTSFLLRVLALSTVVATAFGSPAAAQDVIKTGAPLPLTGPLAPEGLKQKRGYDLWAETANANGGIKVDGKTYKVEIVYTDYASNTPRVPIGSTLPATSTT